MMMTIMDLYNKLAEEWKEENEKRAKLFRQITGIQNIDVAHVIYDQNPNRATFVAYGVKKFVWKIGDVRTKKPYTVSASGFSNRTLPSTKIKGLLNCKNNGPVFQGCTIVNGKYVAISSRPDMLLFSAEGISDTIIGVDYRHGEMVEMSSAYATDFYPLHVSYVPMLAAILESTFDDNNA